ncbi:hypothetical protein [Gracilibacillus dipsosauri]|uniref:Uncharacterized protein n=1 Tax=Gracilibacillus dipsosauri TaxID=178340 RepID=A0A317KV52_9BACI|nr:hypothetical protein [Gracilibacillus dipsosauri]PWU66590.1 hypothetical protein DLJ74_19405 [Gracilibacillus dipsosauri]
MEKIKTYSAVTDALGNTKDGLTKMFIGYDDVDEEGNILGQQNGKILVATEPGYLFGVEEHIPKNYRKLLVRDGDLYIKDGETLDVEVKEQTFQDGIYEIMNQ